MNKEVKSIIQALATEQPDALKLLSLLPAINYCDFSSISHRERIIKEISNIKEIKITNNVGVSFKYRTAQVRYSIVHNDWWIYDFSDLNSSKFITELIATCKSKNIQELLNFI